MRSSLLAFSSLTSVTLVALAVTALGACSDSASSAIPTADGGSGSDGGTTHPPDADGGEPPPPAPTDGVLQVSDVEVSKGLYRCVAITHISANGVKTPVPSNAAITFAGADKLIAPLPPFPAGVTQDCVGFPMKGIAAGAGALQVQWGAAKGAGTVLVEGAQLKIEPGFNALPKDGDATTVVSSIGYPVTLGLLSFHGGKGYLPPGALSFQVTPANVQIAPSGAGSTMTTTAAGTYTLTATFEGSTYPGKNKLQVYDLSGATLEKIDVDNLPMTGITKGTIRIGGFAYSEVYSIDIVGHLFDVSDPAACADIHPSGLFRMADQSLVPGVVTSAKLTFRNRLGAASITGNKFCATKAGDGALDITAPGVDTVTHQFALGTDSFVSIDATASLTSGNLGYSICATVDATVTDKSAAKLDVSASPTLSVDIQCKDCAFPMTMRNSKTGNKYCHTLPNGQTTAGKSKFDVVVGFGSKTKTVSAVLAP